MAWRKKVTKFKFLPFRQNHVWNLFSNPTRVWRRMSLTDIFNNKRMWSNCNPIKDDVFSFQESSLTNFTFPCLLHYLDPTWYSQVSTRMMWLFVDQLLWFFLTRVISTFVVKQLVRAPLTKSFCEVLEKFKFKNGKLRIWAKSPQSCSIMTFNSSFEWSYHEESEFDNYSIQFLSQST